MSEKAMMKRQLSAYKFAIFELMLFLDTHPANAKALELLRDYRKRYDEAVDAYEAKYGPYVVTSDDVKPTGRWNWLDDPWPWEINFMED